MELNIKCANCKNSETINDIKVSETGPDYVLNDILTQINYHKFKNVFLCSKCFEIAARQAS